MHIFIFLKSTHDPKIKIRCDTWDEDSLHLNITHCLSFVVLEFAHI